MGLRTWVKGKFGKADVKPMSYPLRPNPWAEVPQTIDRIIEYGEVQPSSVVGCADQIDDLANQAVGFNNSGHFDKALAIMDEVLDSNPNYAHGWYIKGYALNRLCHYGEAIESYDKAIGNHSSVDHLMSSYYWFGRGEALSSLGRKEEAIASYEKAIEFKPDDHKAWFNRGNSLAALGRKEEAIASYEKAIKFKPDDHEAWFNRGLSLYGLGRNEEAIASYDKAIEIKPDYHGAWHNRALRICSASQNALLKSDIAAFIRHQKIPALNQPQPHLFALQEALPHFQEGRIGWGKIHQSLGDAQIEHAGLRTQKEDWREAVRCYKVALSCLSIESHALDHLEVIQSIVRTLLRLNAIPAARHYQTQGSHLYETLRTQAQDKRTFEAKFSTFRLTEIDLLIGENEPRLALTQAEFYKNRALTWLFDNGQEITHSPTYDRIRSKFTQGTAIVYWHQSNDAITTFILTNNNAEPIVLDCDRQQQHQHFIAWKNAWDNDYDDYRSKNQQPSRIIPGGNRCAIG